MIFIVGSRPDLDGYNLPDLSELMRPLTALGILHAHANLSKNMDGLRYQLASAIGFVD